MYDNNNDHINHMLLRLTIVLISTNMINYNTNDRLRDGWATARGWAGAD